MREGFLGVGGVVMRVEESLQMREPGRTVPVRTRHNGAGGHLVLPVRRTPKHTAALVALALSLALYGLALALVPGIGDEDAALHAMYTRFPTDPSRLLSVWSRPAFAILYLLPAQFGYFAMRVFTVGVCALAAWLTYRVAVRLGLRYAWMAIPLVLLQPCLFGVGMDTMTEPVFALVLAGGLLAFASDRLLLAAAIWSFLPLARPEGPFILVLLAVLWLPRVLHSRRYLAAILLLGLGMVVWELVCYAVTRDWRYLIDTFPWTPTSPVHGTLLHYVRRWPVIVGWGVLPLSLAGLWPGRRDRVQRLCVLMVLTVLALHTLLFAFGKMASWGYDRYFATLAPANALIALAGLAWLGTLAPRTMAYVTGLVLVLQGWQAFTTLVFQPMNYMAGATREAIVLAGRLVDLGTHHVLTADRFGYVFLDDDWGSYVLPVGSHDASVAAIDTLPSGTIVLWDDMVGDWWFHLSFEDFTARGYHLIWSRETTLGSPIAAALERTRAFHNGRLYPWLGVGTTRPMRQALLIRE
jgi:hypothetical protein